MRLKYRVGTMPGPWPTGPGGVDQLWRLVDLCETSGIDSLWFSDRLSSPLHVLEPLTTMAAVAARTRRLKFGPSVIVAPFRSPVLLAREMAMIDYLSGGRMLPAVGIGVEQEGEFRAAGVPFKERGRRTDEAIAIMRRCWADEPVTFAGEFWQLERISVLPRPVQQPFPLWIGGNSEPAMRRAGRLGDGWIPSFITRSRGRRALQGARPSHRRGDRHHAPLLGRRAGNVRRRVLATRAHQRAAPARAAAVPAVDRRQQRAGHAPGRPARRRLDPVVHHEIARPACPSRSAAVAPTRRSPSCAAAGPTSR